MKRLTTSRKWEEALEDLKNELGYSHIWKRLNAIEDILGDDYDLDRLKVLVNQRMTMREEVAERFSITKDIPVDRLRELAEAERDGRCVLLPCKIGTTVYSVRHQMMPDDEYRMSFHEELSVVSQKFGLHHADCIGKTVFLTREAAEAALKGETHDNSL